MWTTPETSRSNNQAKYVGQHVTYANRRVEVVDADDSGCVAIKLWINRDNLTDLKEDQ